MVADSRITARVKSETKERFADFARRQGLSESAMLKRLVDAALMTAAVMQPQVSEPVAQGGKIGGELCAAIAPSVLACQLACLLCSYLREAVSGLGSSATVLGQAEVVEHQRGEDRLVVKGLGVLIEEMCPEIGTHAMIELERLCAAQGGSSAIMRCVITGVP
jgi:hypothetical protein